VTFFFGVVHSRVKWLEWPEADPAVGGAGRRNTGSGGVLMLRWAGSPLLLMMVLMLVVVVVSGAVVVHHPVLRRRTTRWSCHGLPLLGILVGTVHVVRDDNIVYKLRE
jgi:hypothetical protein